MDIAALPLFMLGIGAYGLVTIPADNLAHPTRKEYFADLEDRVEFLNEKASINSGGELSLSSLER